MTLSEWLAMRRRELQEFEAFWTLQVRSDMQKSLIEWDEECVWFRATHMRTRPSPTHKERRHE